MMLHHRRGNALILALLVAAVATVLLSTAADNLFAAKRGQDFTAARQQAALAAESVAALVEAKLTEAAADLAGLKRDIGPATASQWWNLKGYCDGIDQDGNGRDDENGGLWFGNCLVRWRLEPVKVYAASVADPGALTGQRFAVNSENDPALAPARATAATAADPANVLFTQDPQLYHFRIVTEACYLSDPKSAATANPWVDADQRVCLVQAQRSVQLQVVNLFRYALFYAADTPTGDLDLATGTDIVVTGAVHSNGAIYMSSGTIALNALFASPPTPLDYHALSTGDPAQPPPQASVRVGTAAAPTTITGVAGIFRMSRLSAEIAASSGEFPAADNPMLVPLDGVGGMTGRMNINGDTPTTVRHKFNDVAFTSANDSRSALVPRTGMRDAFAGLVRDRQLGATPVRTLASIPQLGGRPFEHQRLAGEGGALYTLAPGSPGDASQHTLFPNANTARLFYTQAPTTFAGAATLTVTPTAFPATGFNLPLFWTDAGRSLADVRPLLANDVTSIGDGDCGFDSNEAKSFYLERALYGKAPRAPGPNALTGLAIRERPAQIALVNSLGATISAKPALSAIPTAQEKEDYALYLRSQYAVYLGGINISTGFFESIRSAADPAVGQEATRNFIVSEDEFVDGRESVHMQYNYSIDPARWPTAADPSYRINVLTLNLRAVQDLLMRTDWNSVGGSSGGKCRTCFNGLIYAHRTRRSLTYHPVLRPTLLWRPGAGLGGLAGLRSAPAAGFPNGVREGDGPIETFRCAIRLRGGADLNWAHDSNGDGVVNGADVAQPLGTSGLTFVTPNRCYLQGDLNTVRHADPVLLDSADADGDGNTTEPLPQVTPCAVFADSANALSNAWSDANNVNYVITGGASFSAVRGTPTTYNTSLVVNNVPTESWNATADGSGLVGNLVRFLEHWNLNLYTLRGSVVVMNAARYTRGPMNFRKTPINMNVQNFSSPRRALLFNSDLLKQAGQPPFSPFGVQVARVISMLEGAGN